MNCRFISLNFAALLAIAPGLSAFATEARAFRLLSTQEPTIADIHAAIRSEDSTVGKTAKANVASPRMEKIFRRERISVAVFSLMSRRPLLLFCRKPLPGSGVILRRCDGM